MVLKIVGLVLPLGLDTFAVAAALGISGLRGSERTRITLLFTIFEAGMPLVGFFGGSLVGAGLGAIADYVAIAILIALAVYMLLKPEDEDEEQRLSLLGRTHGLAAVGLGVSISLDELAIGFTIGLLRLPVFLIIALIAVQTVIVTQLGLRLGSRLGERIREGAERLAGAALGLLGVVLLVEKLLH